MQVKSECELGENKNTILCFWGSKKKKDASGAIGKKNKTTGLVEVILNQWI